MTKVHTRTKRKNSLSHGFSHKAFFAGGKAKPGPKTFKTETSAHEYAKEKGITEYSLVPAKRNKKFKIEAK